jgi:hypothetical protein
MSKCLRFGNNPFTSKPLNFIPYDPLTVDYSTRKSGSLVDPLFFGVLGVSFMA